MRTGSPSKTGMKPMHELKGAMEELARLRLKQHAPHKLKTTWRRLLFGPCLLFGLCAKKVFKNTRHVMTVKTRGSSGTLFFRARFPLFCARFARFRARFSQDPWIISGAKCQHHACQSWSTARRHFLSSKRQPDRVSQSSRSNFVMHSHATGRLLLP